MTADELIEALQKFTPEQRRRDLWMEADAGYAVVGGADLVLGETSEEVIALSPEARQILTR